MIVITAEDALDLLEGAVAKRGADYVYPEEHKAYADKFSKTKSCMYVHKGAPSCIAGQALADAGVPVSTLSRYEHKAVGNVLAALEEEEEISVSAGATSIFRRAQQAQDQGHSWGEAVYAAENFTHM